MPGIRGMQREPRVPARQRRNSQKLATTFDQAFGDGLSLDTAGYIVIDLAASNPGLQFVSGGLAALVQDPILLDASGIGLQYAGSPGGLYLDGGVLTVDHDDAVNFVANEHIDWTGTTENLLTTGNITVDSDLSRLYLGADQDASVYHDGTDMQIITAGDLNVTCGDNKTIELQKVVYKDINLGGAILPAIPAHAPDKDEFVDEGGVDTGIETYAVAVGEGVDGSFELQHDYKEGTDIVFHAHWQGIAAPTGTDNVKWQLTYTVAQNGATLDAATTITVETGFDTQYEFKRSDFAAITGTNFDIGDQFLFRLERIAATADEYGGDALLATVGIHYQVDTLGSRTATTK